MRFMMMVKADKNYEAGIPPNDRLLAAVGQLTGEIARAGSLLEAGGLLPSSQGARVRVADGKLTVIDGPFSEVNQLIGGYAIVRADSRRRHSNSESASCEFTQRSWAHPTKANWRSVSWRSSNRNRRFSATVGHAERAPESENRAKERL